MSADEEQCKLIGGRMVGEVCMVDDYPTATGRQIDTPAIHDMIRECDVLHLRPEDYLKIVPKTEFSMRILKDLRMKIRNKQPLDMPWIEMGDEDCGWMWKLACITGQEGRHRAKGEVG